ncbi:MAG: alpha/beta hydrolase [Alphaproteobacteria bacterium]|nr:alpha/beta hydrolase [Alphaproteobacteria bacterium]
MTNTQKKRSGPRPLCIHTGLLQANAASYGDFAQDNFIPYSNEDRINIIRGIQKYQNSTYSADRPSLSSQYEYKGIHLLTPDEEDKENVQYKRSLLLIPSLINNANIFNLNKDRSFALWLQQNDIEVFILDWGDISKTNPDVTMETLVAEILPHMIHAASDRAQNSLDILGYCMGGTLLLGGLSFTAVNIGKIIFLAVPWDFHSEKSGFFKSLRLWSPFALETIQRNGYLPSLWVEFLFAMLDMSKAGSKFMDFDKMDPRSEQARLFIDVEDWLNSGCDIPKHIAQYCIKEWFSGNVTAQNKWIIKDCVIDPSSYKNDVLIIASDKDKITPYECTEALEKQLGNANVTVLKESCGHISYIAGQNAVASIWEPLLEWVKE